MDASPWTPVDESTNATSAWTPVEESKAAPTETNAPEDHSGFWNSLKEDLTGMVKGLPNAAPPVQAYHDLRSAIDTIKEYQKTGKFPVPQAAQDYERRKEAGYSLPYRVLAPVAEGLGVNVTGMEESAAKGDVGGVAGHAALPAALATGGLAAEGATRLASTAKTNLGKGMTGLSERMYRSALKPSTAQSPAEAAAEVTTGLKEKIPVSEEGAEKLGKLASELHDQVRATVAAGQQPTISPGASAAPVRAVESKFAKQVNPTSDLADIAKSRDEFLDQFRSVPGGSVRNMTPTEAQDLKEGTYRQIGKKYGELSSATVETQKGIIRGIKEELEKQFPEIAAPNQRQSKLYDLKPDIERAVNRISNKDILGLGGKIAAVGAGAVGAGAMGGEGAALAGGGAAAAAAILHQVLNDATLQSKLAIALNRAAPSSIPLSTAKARVAAYTSALALARGQAESNGRGSEQSPSQ